MTYLGREKKTKEENESKIMKYVQLTHYASIVFGNFSAFLLADMWECHCSRRVASFFSQLSFVAPQASFVCVTTTSVGKYYDRGVPEIAVERKDEHTHPHLHFPQRK